MGRKPDLSKPIFTWAVIQNRQVIAGAIGSVLKMYGGEPPWPKLLEYGYRCEKVEVYRLPRSPNWGGPRKATKAGGHG